ncbi:MAG: hypothetical protein Ct9H90mP9_3300 [Pseudomonadota bacterium]|nr:MAG: hypothetical protein Ct9H90mP9_3300 [Pseudomonadota bacterium]
MVGQQNFEMGAVVSLCCCCRFGSPSCRPRGATQASRSSFRTGVPSSPSRNPCGRTSVHLLHHCRGTCGHVAMAAYASFVTFWPYNLTFLKITTLSDGRGWLGGVFQLHPHGDLLSIFGTGLIFVGGFLVGKRDGCLMASKPRSPCCNASACRSRTRPRYCLYFLLQPPEKPLAFSTAPWDPGICTIVHFYTVSHLPASPPEATGPDSRRVLLSLKKSGMAHRG